jgi:hypothetical protein
MREAQREVLEALKAQAARRSQPGEWAEVAPWDIYHDLIANLSEDGFRGVLHALEMKGSYRAISDDRGFVKL